MVDNILLEEWKETRSVIARFDQNIFNLRKYGFTFVTGLLAANGFLLKQFEHSNSEMFTMIPIIANLALILALQFYENAYIVWQRGAIFRSQTLEKILNLELTEAIAYFGKRRKTRYYGFIMYSAIISAIFFLSFFADNGGIIFLIIVIVTSIIQIMYYSFIYFNAHRALGYDWTINKSEAHPGDLIKITVTNITGNKQEIMEGQVICVMEPQIGDLKDPLRSPKDVVLKNYESYTWVWVVPDKINEIYRINVCLRREYDNDANGCHACENDKISTDDFLERTISVTAPEVDYKACDAGGKIGPDKTTASSGP
jgi:hypothetical protein